jgi:hypothetical protein
MLKNITNMTVIEINESKFDKMSEYTEKMLKYGGKLMSCLEELGEEHGYGHRGGSYGNRYDSMGGRYSDHGTRYGMGYRDDEDWDDDDEMMGQRRGRGRRRDSRGRYM